MQFKYMVIGECLYGSDKRKTFTKIDLDPIEAKKKNVTNVDFNDPRIFEDWKFSSHPNSNNIK